MKNKNKNTINLQMGGGSTNLHEEKILEIDVEMALKLLTDAIKYGKVVIRL